MSLKFPISLVGKRGLDAVSQPLHWWDVENLTTGMVDRGDSTSRFDLGKVSSGGGLRVGEAPDGTDCVETPANVYLANKHPTPLQDIAWDGSGNDVSVSIWARCIAIASTGNWVFSWRASTTAFCQINIQSDKIQAVLWNDNGNFIIAETTGLTPALDTWYHITFTFNATDKLLKLYVNGELEATEPYIFLGGFSLPTDAFPFAMGVASWSKANTSLQHNGYLWAAG